MFPFHPYRMFLLSLIPAFVAMGSDFAGSAFAAPDEPTVPSVIVTASRIAETADQALAPVTVITRQDIERSQALSVQDVLRGQPGITLYNNGGLGKNTSIVMRGTNANHVLVMIDGMKVGSASTGQAAFQDMPIELIDRIEIVRGPRSSLYGSEAIGGVIQIFTKKGRGPTSIGASVTGGSYRTREETASMSGSAGENGWYSLGLSDFSTEGFNNCRGHRSLACGTFEADRDGYRNRAGRARAGWRFGDLAEIEGTFMQSNGFNKFDGNTNNENSSVSRVAGTSLGVTPLDWWRATLRGGRSEDLTDNLKNGVYVSRFNTERHTASWQNEVEINASNKLVAGADWLNDKLDSSTLYLRDSRSNRGLFGQYLTTIFGHDLQGSVRRDINEQFGIANTGSIAWGYNVIPELRLIASYGTAFKAPTFNELYFPNFGTATNKPERSRSKEVGFNARLADVNWTFNLYRTEIEDLIATSAGRAINVQRAEIQGMENSLDVTLFEWRMRGNLNLLDPRNMGQGLNQNKMLPRRSPVSYGVHVDRDIGDWGFGASVRGEDRRYDELANTTELAPYATIDLRGEYRINQSWRLQTRVENLLNQDYQTAYLYNQPGVSVYFTLRYKH